MLEKTKKVMGCTEVSQIPRLKIGNISYKTCPGNFFSQSALTWIEAHERFQEGGVLPFSGGYMDQPYKVMEIFRIIGGFKTEELNKQYERQRMKMQGMRGKKLGR